MGFPATNLRHDPPSPFDAANPDEVNVFLLGCGVVGGELIEQLEAERSTLLVDHGVDVRLVGVANSRRIVQGIGPVGGRRARRLLDCDPVAARGVQVLPNTEENLAFALRRLTCERNAVLVDATACDGHTALFQDAVDLGIHVVTANKKPLVVEQAKLDLLRKTGDLRRRPIRCETTVGAGLPVIATLRSLRRTGDRIERIEGSLSGTLGYLVDETSRGVPLTRAVRRARELGYTEPHPAEDLSGVDVARKALILARELGLKLELDDVEIEPLVPRDLLQLEKVDAFLAALQTHDDEFAARVERASAHGGLLRYLAVIDPQAEVPVRVGPVCVEHNHPAAALRGTEALVSYRTSRYRDFPLTIRGPGAGGAVTASGLLDEVIGVAKEAWR